MSTASPVEASDTMTPAPTFAGKHNIRDSGTLAQMRDTVAALVGQNLLYRDLIADNGLPSGARPRVR